MFDSAARFLKGLSLVAHARWLGALLVFPVLYLFAVNPDMTDRPLSRSEGSVLWVGKPKGGYDVKLRTDEHINKSKQVFIRWARSTIIEAGAIRVGQHLRVDRYGDEVGNCWIDNRQVCVSKCSSDLQCKQKQAASNLQVLYWGVGLTLFGYLFTLTWVACGGRIYSTPKIKEK